MSSTATALPALTPVQRRTLDALRRPDEDVVFDAETIEGLIADAVASLDELGRRLGGEQLVVTKHALDAVLGCEARFLAPDPFAWSPANAMGTVTHKAVQLWLNWRGEPAPRDVIDEALSRLADERSSIGDYVAALGSGEEAELRSRCVELLTKFIEGFPPLDMRAHPVTETAIRFPVDGAIVLTAKVDLVVGRPHASAARRVIIDWKSGRIVDRHRQDLRFYALVETLCRGIPPRLLVSYSLDGCTPVVEPVSPVLLRSTLLRTLDAVRLMIDLRVTDREPTRTPGVMCRWCQLLPACPPGQASLAEADMDAAG